MTFGDNGVSCKLSKRLPDYVKTNVADFVDEVGFLGGFDRVCSPLKRAFLFPCRCCQVDVRPAQAAEESPFLCLRR